MYFERNVKVTQHQKEKFHSAQNMSPLIFHLLEKVCFSLIQKIFFFSLFRIAGTLKNPSLPQLELHTCPWRQSKALCTTLH